ncbi:AMP-binding protein [Kitasatospora sp. NPDC092286]|uniref:AMP-binding protein n=1 Tax=Kitasatospora sp. NPDC092286 TaxID=3364087 RepID=UPI00382F8C37
MDDRILPRFLAHPGRRPAAVALDGAVLTFDEVLGRALALARQLRATTEVTGRVVLLRTGPGALFSVADLAVLLAGGVPAVLPDLTHDQLAALWPVVEPAAVLDTVGDRALADIAGRARTPVHTVNEHSTRPGGTPAQWRTVARRMAGRRLEQTAAIVFTSGTTGVPRAVALTEAALVRGTDTWTGLWRGRPARTLSYLPVSHVAQRIMGHTLMCLYGTTLVSSTPERLEEDLVRHRADTLLGVPHIWARLAAACEQPGNDGQRLRQTLAGVRTAVNGAAALDPVVAGALHRHAGLRISGAYGATESTVPAFHQDDAATPGLGRPVGVEHRVDDDGQLLLRGPYVAAGYVEQWPHLIPVSGPDGWLHTGDRASRDESAAGGLRLSGRIGSAFKTGSGVMIHPEPIEAHLLTHPRVDAACLLGPGLPRAVALVSAPSTADWLPVEVAALEGDLHRGVEQARRSGALPYCDLATVHVLPDRWPEELLVTSTGKPRRDLIAVRYSNLLPTTQEPARALA